MPKISRFLLRTWIETCPKIGIKPLKAGGTYEKTSRWALPAQDHAAGRHAKARLRHKPGGGKPQSKEIERAFETGIDLSDRTTVAQWAIKWVQEYKSGLRENTQRSILRNLNLHILPVLGNMRMQDVKEVHCRADKK